MVNKKSLVLALDTNIFIYYFQSDPRFGAAAREIFKTLVSGQNKALTSIVSLVEIMSLPMDEKASASLKSHFLETPNLTVYDADQAVGLETARIRRKYGFRTPDAIQLATALIFKADKFITNDKRLKKFDEVEVQLLSQDQ